MTARQARGGHARDGFPHPAVVIDSDRSLRTVLVPGLRRSLRAREPVLMVVSDHTAAVERQKLGVRSGDLAWGDPTPHQLHAPARADLARRGGRLGTATTATVHARPARSPWPTRSKIVMRPSGPSNP
jgi:hypothetical protein